MNQMPSAQDEFRQSIFEAHYVIWFHMECSDSGLYMYLVVATKVPGPAACYSQIHGNYPCFISGVFMSYNIF